MFDLDLELDFDDDFSSNSFTELSNRVKEVNKNLEVDKLNASLPLPVNKTDILLRQDSSINNEYKSSKSGISNPDDFLNPPLLNKFNLSSQDISTKLKRSIEEDEKPQKKKLTHEGLLQRKFPGPAGLLPDKPFKEIENFPLLENKSFIEENCKKGNNEPVIYSQNSGSIFLESPYQKLVSNFDLNEPNNPLNKYTIEWVKKTALNKCLQGRKVPFLAVIIHYINNSTPDPVLVLRDPTGEINGTLHREVWADMGEKLHSGIALALRQVGVLITGVMRRQVHLNITINNILSIYSTSSNCKQVEIMAVNSASKEDLFKSIEGWQAQVSRNQTPKFSSKPNTLFSTVTEIKPSKHSSNFDLDNIDIKNFKNSCVNFAQVSQFKNKETSKEDSENTRSDFETSQILFSDRDFIDEISISQNNSHDKVLNSTFESKNKDKVPGPCLESKNKTAPFQIKDPNHTLSQAESLIFEEVLSGINLDEFD